MSKSSRLQTLKKKEKWPCPLQMFTENHNVDYNGGKKKAFLNVHRKLHDNVQIMMMIAGEGGIHDHIYLILSVK